MRPLTIKDFKKIFSEKGSVINYFSYRCYGYEFCLEVDLDGVWRMSFCNKEEEVLIEEFRNSKESVLKLVNELYQGFGALNII